MPHDDLPIVDQSDQKAILDQIKLLRNELEQIQKETQDFENFLRSRLTDLIVESNELYSLYKKIKKAKKAKRLEQKKRGKNYKEPKGIRAIPKKKNSSIITKDQKEKKRLYREAMLHVHPDKFNLSKKETDIATDITIRLIEIYKNESLETLQAYHTHIFKGNTLIPLSDASKTVKTSKSDDYLQREKERFQKEIISAKNNHLYKVLKEYDSPLTYEQELKEYYEDRIIRLKRRTRKGL